MLNVVCSVLQQSLSQRKAGWNQCCIDFLNLHAYALLLILTPFWLKIMWDCCILHRHRIWPAPEIDSKTSQMHDMWHLPHRSQHFTWPMLHPHLLTKRQKGLNPHNTVWGHSDAGRSFPCTAKKPSASQFWDFMTLSGYLLWFHFRQCSPIPRINDICIIKYVLGFDRTQET